MKYVYSILISCVLAAAFFTFCNRDKPVMIEKTTIDSIKKPTLKVVFVVVGKDIDYDKMNIDTIVDIIQKDSILEIKSMTPEFYIKPQIIKVYRVEDITCPFLKKRFKDRHHGELVYEYNGKILIKLNDGVIKVYHNHVEKEAIKNKK